MIRTLSRCGLLLFTLLVGCGGSGSAVRTLPSNELSALAYLPEDAFFVFRLDVRAVRGIPNFGAIEAAVRETDATMHSALLETDVVYVAVGGLMDAPVPPEASAQTPLADVVPATPEPDAAEPTDEPEGGDDVADQPPEAQPGDPLYEAPEGLEDAMPITQAVPAWVEMSRALGGKIAAIVFVVEGAAAARCHADVEGAVMRESRGFRIATKEGWAVAVRDRLCVMTFEPIVDRVLAGHEGAPRIVDRLAGAGENNDLGLMGFAFELGTPAFRAIADALRPGEETTEAQEDGKYLALAERIFAAMTEGIEAVEWQLGRSGASYASRTRVQASNRDRGTMWRELTRMYLDIFGAVGESGVGGEELTHVFATLRESTEVQNRDDGFVLVTRIPDESVTSLVDSLMSNVPGGADSPILAETSAFASAFEEQPDLAAAERIAMLEPAIEQTMAATAGGGYFVPSLASAYATVGRFADAEALYRRSLEASPSDAREWVAVELAELHIETGHLDDAKTLLTEQIAACEATGECAQLLLLRLELSLVRALSGDEAALAEVDMFLGSPGAAHEGLSSATRGRVLLALGRPLEAVGALETVCAQSSDACASILARTTLADAFARSSLPLSRVLPSIERLLGGAEGVVSRRHDEDAMELLYVCSARLLREPTAQTTRDACRVAVERATTLHGATHPVTGAAALEYARALGSDRAGVARELARVDAVIATLGPQHPLRAERAAFGTRARPR